MSAIAVFDGRATDHPAGSARGWEGVVETIHRAVGPAPVILAGSRATGASNEGSDYDLVVVLPLRRIPRALGRLSRARAELERTLGAPVSLNPLPRFQAQRGATNLFVWKLHHEGVALSMPDDFSFKCPARFRVTPSSAYSYLMTAVFLLLDACDAPAPVESWDDARLSRGVRKALLHVIQLRLLKIERYAATLDEALEIVDDDQMRLLTSRAHQPSSWFATRELVLGELTGMRLPAGVLRTLARNAQYASLSHLRGKRRMASLVGPHPVEYELGDAAIGLLRAVDDDGVVRADALAVPSRHLPAWLHAPTGDWRGLRDALREEWASAHALMGL